VSFSSGVTLGHKRARRRNDAAAARTWAVYVATLIGAIDVGSNSIRVAVIRVDGNGSIEVIEEAREVPQLMREIRQTGRFKAETLTRITDILAEFQAIAIAAGAEKVVAVATSAVRESENAAALIKLVFDRTGIALRVIEGTAEARLAFMGAVHSLPVDDGIVVDIGGGSLEFARFANREVTDSWTLPLGALRVSDEFLKADPPTAQQIRATRRQIASEIERVGVPPLAPGGQLVGTGGSVRNLAKIDRARQPYPIPQLHGYVLPAARLQALGDLVQSRRLANRVGIRGLNPDRAETIVAGALIAQTVLEALDAPSITVSGQGLREGMAIAECADALPTVEAMRGTSIDQLVERFAPQRTPASRQRVRILSAVVETLGLPATTEMRAALQEAAQLLDIGRSIDFYNRHRHTEELLLGHGLAGFTHRELALIGAIVRRAEDEKASIAPYAPLLTPDDEVDVARAGTLLALADEFGHQLVGEVPFDSALVGNALVVDAEIPNGRETSRLAARFERVFGLRWRIQRESRASAS
jgi:exopolyphosphatase / guanosine-5'-triphosphate,3'-diphosphate pyrophosphatase